MRTNTPGSLSLFTQFGSRKYLNSDERQSFLAVAARNPRVEIRAFCAILAHTGCRVSEALALTATSLDLAGGFVAIRCLKKRTKVTVVREVPLPPDLICALRKFIDLNPTDTNRIWPWSRSRAWQIVKEVMREAGVINGPHATPKGLRHGFGLHAIRCGVPINLVQRWLGHASINTTAIYLQAMGPEEREFAARMWANTGTRASAAA